MLGVRCIPRILSHCRSVASYVERALRRDVTMAGAAPLRGPVPGICARPLSMPRTTMEGGCIVPLQMRPALGWT
ncbi:hypothetical protein BV25DRAFT_1832900 [Artomyces pyxidatus]|uniref:Uncharacterized protein n=1 Tax=Artomyces pyxidatus TaxID=48021 RepID=A0ACB8SIR0_9AGAM|nr:hypothetical protein BV25DRAFT_1832900 [Artomyces pyxidatus]